MNSYTSLSFEVDADRIGLLTLRCPAQHNSLNETLKAELRQLMSALAHDRELAALVITGEGRSFCSGGDLQHLKNTERTADLDRRRLYGLHDWVQPLMNLELPVIAAVNGPAIGAGFGLALAADFVLCAPQAYFRASFCRVGLVPDTGLFFTLPRIVGLQSAKEIIFTGRKIGAAEAHALRIAFAVHPDARLLPEAMALARRFSQGPTAAIGASKRILNQSFHLDARALVEMEAAAQAIFFHSAFHLQAIDDFAKGAPWRFDWESPQ
jgi:2-(1,2-epoxy-1,2-dihydrophenyl)acetyl-CoA isomerase